MIDKKRLADPSKKTALGQIEINTFACGGVAIYSKLVQFYR
jgi:hypothetical protein